MSWRYWGSWDSGVPRKSGCGGLASSIRGVRDGCGEWTGRGDEETGMERGDGVMVAVVVR